MRDLETGTGNGYSRDRDRLYIQVLQRNGAGIDLQALYRAEPDRAGVWVRSGATRYGADSGGGNRAYLQEHKDRVDLKVRAVAGRWSARELNKDVEEISGSDVGRWSRWTCDQEPVSAYAQIRDRNRGRAEVGARHAGEG